MTKHSKPKRHKHYRAKPVYGIPPILLRTENAEDQVKNLERASRDALLKFHFGTADEKEFSMLLRALVVIHRLTNAFEEEAELREPITKAIVALLEMQILWERGEGFDSDRLALIEDSFEPGIEVLKKSTIFDTLEALSYFDSNYQEVMGNLRRYVRQGLDEGDESLAEVARKGAL